MKSSQPVRWMNSQSRCIEGQRDPDYPSLSFTKSRLERSLSAFNGACKGLHKVTYVSHSSRSADGNDHYPLSIVIPGRMETGASRRAITEVGGTGWPLVFALTYQTVRWMDFIKGSTESGDDHSHLKGISIACHKQHYRTGKGRCVATNYRPHMAISYNLSSCFILIGKSKFIAGCWADSWR